MRGRKGGRKRCGGREGRRKRCCGEEGGKEVCGGKYRGDNKLPLFITFSFPSSNSDSSYGVLVVER